MNDLRSVLIDFVDGLYSTTDPSTMFSVLESTIKKLGFDYISYTFMPSVILTSLSNSAPVFQVSQGYNQKFIQHYAEANFIDNDYTVKMILKGDMNTRNWWQDEKGDRLSELEKSVINVARYEYGIKSGITIPTFTDGHGVAGVSVSSEEGENAFSLLYSEKIKFLERISLMYSDRVLGISSAKSFFGASILEKMTKTEIRVVSMMAKGINIQAIAHELNLDYKYIANKVLPSIRRKMGGVSRDRMMYNVGRMAIDRELVF